MEWTQWLTGLADTGVLGTVLVLALAALYAKDKQLTKANEKHTVSLVEMVGNFRELSAKTHATLEDLTRLLERRGDA